jgi:hypothetical protein
MYIDPSKNEPPKPTPTNPVNLVNPIQNPHSTARRDPASKPNRSGSPLQTNVLDRTENESDPDQKRTEPEPKVENLSQPFANPPTQNLENQKKAEPTEPTLFTPSTPRPPVRPPDFPFHLRSTNQIENLRPFQHFGHLHPKNLGHFKFSIRPPQKAPPFQSRQPKFLFRHGPRASPTNHDDVENPNCRCAGDLLPCSRNEFGQPI